jgi:hypothetical protein
VKGFVKNPIGRDIEYVLQSNSRVAVIRGCKCQWNCDRTWHLQVDQETIEGGYYRYFKDALRGAREEGALQDRLDQ